MTREPRNLRAVAAARRGAAAVVPETFGSRRTRRMRTRYDPGTAPGRTCRGALGSGARHWERGSWAGRFAVAVLLGVLCVPAVHAQDDSAAIRVFGVPSPLRVGLGEPLRLTVRVPADSVLPQELRLFLDGYPVPALPMERVEPVRPVVSGDEVIAYDHYLEFALERSAANRDAWARLLGGHACCTTPVTVGVGPVGRAEYPRPVGAKVEFVIIREGWLILMVALGIGVVASLLWLGATTTLLRDPPPRDPTPGPAAPPTDPFARRPYSLAKTAMAYWFVIILGSFLVLWAITGEFNGLLTKQSLVLLGIVGATAVAGQGVTENNLRQLNANIHRTEREHAALMAERAGLTRQPAPQPLEVTAEMAALGHRTREVEERIERLRSLVPKEQGFVFDLLRDGNGLALQRFQNVVWHLVLGVVFVVAVWRTLALPELGEELLILLGISEGLYLGLKIPELPKGQRTGGGSI